MKASELRTIYLSDRDRFVVSLVIGYGDTDGVKDARTAAAAALRLTRDDASGGTTWFVFDRKTGDMHQFEQSEFESLHVR